MLHVGAIWCEWSVFLIREMLSTGLSSGYPQILWVHQACLSNSFLTSRTNAHSLLQMIIYELDKSIFSIIIPVPFSLGIVAGRRNRMGQRTMIKKIAVLGSASGGLSEDQHERAYAVGAAIAEAGCVLLTGACPGLPQDAVSGAKAKNGFTIGISPAACLEEHITVYGYPANCSVLIFTGMGRKGRNVILVRSADACIFVGGGMGTLNEFTIALEELDQRGAIAIMTGSGGVAEELPRLVSKYGPESSPVIIQESDPRTIVKRIVSDVLKEPAL